MSWDIIGSILPKMCCLWVLLIAVCVMDISFLFWCVHILTLSTYYTLRWIFSFGSQGGYVEGYYRNLEYYFQILPVRKK